jgi:hypothetical protein
VTLSLTRSPSSWSGSLVTLSPKGKHWSVQSSKISRNIFTSCHREILGHCPYKANISSIVYMDLVKSFFIGRPSSFLREASWHSSFRGRISSIIYESRDTAPKEVAWILPSMHLMTLFSTGKPSSCHEEVSWHYPLKGRHRPCHLRISWHRPSYHRMKGDADENIKLARFGEALTCDG